MMQVREQLLRGCYVIETIRRPDDRGVFSKLFSRDGNGLFQAFSCAECFSSWSVNNVIRGMHLQVGPAMLDKIVTCLYGSILDVLVDLRSGPDFGKVRALDLGDADSVCVFVPKGVAHGFLTRSDRSLVVYLTTSVHAPEFDRGVHWASLDFTWPVGRPIVSERDESLPALAAFEPLRLGPGGE